MRRFLLGLLVVGGSGCTTFGGPKTASNWYALEKADKVTCALWPLREHDLQIDDLALVGTRKLGFLATGLQRNASPLAYYAEFKDDTAVDPDDFVPLTFGPGAVVVGGGDVGGENVVVVARNSGTQASIEVRTVNNNVVRFKGPLGAFEVVEGTSVASKGGLWITLKTDAGSYREAFVDLRTKGKVTAKLVNGVSVNERPTALASATRPGALLVWREGETGKPFKAQSLAEDLTLGQPTVLDIAVTEQVESWSAAAGLAGYYLAVVDGDSLIGQAELKISFFNWKDGEAKVVWSQAAQLKDVHATEPVFLATAATPELLLLNWIDEESTIARYNIAGGTLGTPKYAGIFPKGSRIVTAFTGGSSDDLYVLTRHRSDTRWAFQLCEL